MRHVFARHRVARLTTAAALFASAFVAACSSDSVTSSVAPPSDRSAQVTGYKAIKLPVGGILKMLFPMEPLVRDDSILEPITRSFTFGKSGGKIEIKETGLRVDVPSGAIPGNSLTITVTALRGDAVAYDFQPHGTVFLKPLSFQQELKNTSWDKSGFKGVLIGGYFEDVSQLNIQSGLAFLDELYPVLIDSNRAKFDIKHFSGYMVSGGRQGLYSDDQAQF